MPQTFKGKFSKQISLDDWRNYRQSSDVEFKIAFRNNVVERNRGLVTDFCRKFSASTNADFLEDIIQQGMIGLLKAVEHFDPERGYRFSTCATQWIRQGVFRYFKNNSSPIRIPIGTYDEINRLLAAQQRFISEHQYRPSMKELADFTGKSEIQVSQLISDWSTHLVGSLDDILAGTEDFHPFDTVAADPGCDPLEQLLAKEGDFQGVTRDVLSGVLDSLPQRHKDILELRYGHELTLSEIGKIYGLSREGVRLIEYKALRMVRARLYSGSRPIAYQQETRLKRQLGKKT